MREIRPVDYEWKELEGLHELLQFLDGKNRRGEDHVIVDGKLRDNAFRWDSWMEQKYPVFNEYGVKPRYVDDSVEFDDGSVLVCVSVATWGGTFATHDDVHVKWYGLTPWERSPAPTEKKTK